MRAMLAASVLTLFPAVLAAQPASGQAARGSVYLTVMGEPVTAPAGQSALGAWFSKADSDRNGGVSLAELTADSERFFKTLDIDSDGRIGGYEMTRYEEEVAPLSLRAAAGARPIVYARQETTPGSSSNYNDAENSRRSRSGVPGQSNDPSISLGAGNERRSAGSTSIPQPVAMTDVDLSGSVTPEEFARAASRRLAAADVNKNGQLELGELSGRAR